MFSSCAFFFFFLGSWGARLEGYVGGELGKVHFVVMIFHIEHSMVQFLIYFYQYLRSLHAKCTVHR